MMIEHRERHYRAFTLIELLVVVAIIAVLVSILLPAMGRARDQTRLAICKARLHSIGTAVTAYAGANNGFQPVEPKLDNPHKTLIETLKVTDPEVFYCPSATDEAICLSDENIEAGNISYFYFSCTNATANRDASTFLRRLIKWPRILRATMEPQTWVAADCWFSGQPTAHRYFKKGINYLLIDGSVHMLNSGASSVFK